MSQKSCGFCKDSHTFWQPLNGHTAIMSASKRVREWEWVTRMSVCGIHSIF